jgi:hypothetical protein
MRRVILVTLQRYPSNVKKKLQHSFLVGFLFRIQILKLFVSLFCTLLETVPAFVLVESESRCQSFPESTA